MSRIVTDVISIRSVAFPLSSTGASEIFWTTLMPSTTRANTVYWPSSTGWSTTQMKNCEPPLSGFPGSSTLDTAPLRVLLGARFRLQDAEAARAIEVALGGILRERIAALDDAVLISRWNVVPL